jgi:glycosyltransferase involved in cell wall biosynthesis
MQKPEVLFVFTKTFPYGTAEQYLVDEVNYLASSFDKVVFVPCEYFGDPALKLRELPAKCEFLLINKLAASRPAKRKWSEILYVFLFEFFHARKKGWILGNLKRHFSVLLHQAQCAAVFAEELQNEYGDCKKVFYSYWIHNCTVMLGILKRNKTISGFVSRAHAIDLYEWDWDMIRVVEPLPYYNFTVHNLTRLYSISKHGADYLKGRFPGFTEKILISRLGVNDKGLNPERRDEIFTMVSCSGVDKRKRISVIAEVISKMKTPVRWIHFGKGPAMAEVEAKVREFPSSSSAELKGFVDNTNVMKFYKEHHIDLFLNLSEAEGIPVALMEAISFGIPVFATSVNGNPEIANEKTGFCVRFDLETEQMADIIDKFAANEAEQQRCRKGAREFYEKEFSASTNYSSFAIDLHKTMG